MIIKTVEIDGKQVKFANSAAIPRLYRILFGEDVITDMDKLRNAIDEAKDSLPIDCLTIFENIAYTMAKHADKTIPDTIDEWLDEFTAFDIYQILPDILQLWVQGLEQKSTPKKENEQ